MNKDLENKIEAAVKTVKKKKEVTTHNVKTKTSKKSNTKKDFRIKFKISDKGYTDIKDVMEEYDIKLAIAYARFASIQLIWRHWVKVPK